MTWFTFLPSFLFILAGGPLVESTHGNLKFTAPLTAITAAVVGVIASLALFFLVHIAWRTAAAGAPRLQAGLGGAGPGRGRGGRAAALQARRDSGDRGLRAGGAGAAAGRLGLKLAPRRAADRYPCHTTRVSCMTNQFTPVTSGARLSDQVAQQLAGRNPRGPPGRRRETAGRGAAGGAVPVSRTVVREAVSRLKSLGLVDSRQGSGVYVSASPPYAPLNFDARHTESREAVVQMAEVRRALEAEAAGAGRATPHGRRT